MPLVHDETSEPAGGDITVNAPSQHSPWVQGGIDVVEGAGRGIAKGVAGMIPESVEGKDWKDWSSKYEPGSSQAEQWGEFGGTIGANVAPFFAGGPILEGISQATKIPRIGTALEEGLGTLALRARTAKMAGMTPAQMVGEAGQKAQRAYESARAWGARGAKTVESAVMGAGGGAGEAAIQSEDEKDPKKFGEKTKTGAVEGGVTASAATILRLGYEVLPSAIKRMVDAGAIGMSVVGGGLLLHDKMGRGHWIPWHAIYGAAYPLYEMGKAALRVPPAAIGAASERIREKTHPESKGNEDELVQ